MKKIPLARPYYDQKELNAVAKVLESRWVAQGPLVEEFEKEFARYIGVRHAIAVNSCTSALHLSLLALGIKKGDEVIVPDFTFPATGNAVLFCGATPVLADIKLDSFNIDPESFKKRITPRTKCVIPVHIFGLPADMKNIMEIAEKYDIKVIEDAACAHGAEWCDRKAGSFGVTGCFSFHARKIISTGEGGMIVTNDDEVAERLRALRSHGMKQSAWMREKRFTLPSFEEIGYNFRMSDITAAIGLVQLQRIEKFLAERRSIAEKYSRLIEEGGLPVQPPVEPSGTRHSYQSYVILLKKKGVRDDLIASLQNSGVGCTIGTYSLSNLPLFSGKCPNGTFAFKNSIALPLYTGMGDDEIEYVTTCMKNYFICRT